MLQRPLAWRTFSSRRAMIDALRAHQIDAATSATGNDDGPALLYSRPYLDTRQVFVERNVHDTPNHRIAFVRAQTSLQAIRRAYPAFDAIAYPDTLSALLAVSLGDVDAFVGDIATAGYTIDHQDLSNLTLSAYAPFDEAGYRFAFTADSTGEAWRQRVDAAIGALPPHFLSDLRARWAGVTAVTFAQPLVLNDAERAWVAAHPVVRYSTYSDAAPLAFRDTNGMPAGLAVDTLDAIGRTTGLQFEGIMRDSIKASTDDLAQHRAMILAHGFVDNRSTPGRIATQPTGESVLVIVTRSDAEPLRDAAALAGKRVALWENPSLMTMLREQAPSAHIVETAPVGGQFDAVLNRSADAAVIDLTVAHYAVGNAYHGKLAITGAFSTQPVQYGFLVSNDEPVLLGILNHAIEHMHPAEFDAIRRRWLLVGHPESLWQRRRPQVFAAALIALALLGIIVGWVISLRKQIARRRVVQRALSLARQDAENANRAKSAFLAAMSHEIRTPMNAVLGLIELELRNPGDRAASQRTLGTAHQAGRDLLGMIDDLLDIAKIEAGRLTLVAAPFEWQTWLQGTVDVYEPVARAKGLTLTVKAAGERQTAWFDADAMRLRQVLGNLLSNAIKFTETGGVTIEYSIGDSVGAPRETVRPITFSVVDTGMGIPPDQQAMLFTPFVQAEHGQVRRFAGSGLGLTICRRLITLMAGTVSLASTPGKGSRFTVQLRLPAAEPVIGERGTQSAAGMKAPALSGLRVLVVDDHPASRLLLQSQLDALGCIASTENDGRAGLSAWREHRFDVVITDCSMPVMSGEDLARAIRVAETSRENGHHGDRLHTPVIGMTANAQPEFAQEAMASGMTRCLVKPLGLDALRDVLLTIVRDVPESSHASAVPTGLLSPLVASVSEVTSKTSDVPIYAPEHNEVSRFVSTHEAVHVLGMAALQEMSTQSYTQASSTFAPDAGHVPVVSVRVDSSMPAQRAARYDAALIRGFGSQGIKLVETVQYANREDLKVAAMAYRSLDFDTLSQVAHRVKGAALVIGAQPLADACRALQDACAQDENDARFTDSAFVHVAYQRFRAQIHALDAALVEHFYRENPAPAD